MSKLNPGSNRYFKAQLRPLTKPAFWASAGLFGVSLFALTTLFKQPDTVLSNGDRDAVVNLDENESLTPEERARAAEIDDLSVLLKDLDKSQTIDSVSGRLNDTQTTNLKAPEAIANLDNSQPNSPITSSSGDFQQLPLLDLSPQSQINATGTAPANSGFVGFDPRSSGQVGSNASTPTTNTITPLAAALERNCSTANAAPLSTPGSSPASALGTAASTATSTSGQRTGIPSNGVQPNGSPIYSPSVSTPALTTPNYSSPSGSTPQNSGNNAYSQLLNPNLVVPTAPLASTTAPTLTSQPAAITVSPLAYPQAGRNNSGTTAPSLVAPQATNSTTVFGAPASQSTTPVLSNPAPFSVPNRTPGQATGNGQINTFANP